MAVQRGEAKLQTEPQAKAVSYEQATNRLIIKLKNEVIFQLPCRLVQGLADAMPDDITKVDLGPRGASLHWEKLNLSFSLIGLIMGSFGTQAWMQELGRMGGNTTSIAKATAARINGKKVVDLHN